MKSNRSVGIARIELPEIRWEYGEFEFLCPPSPKNKLNLVCVALQGNQHANYDYKEKRKPQITAGNARRKSPSHIKNT